jgi:hypothetical protein
MWSEECLAVSMTIACDLHPGAEAGGVEGRLGWQTGSCVWTFFERNCVHHRKVESWGT